MFQGYVGKFFELCILYQCNNINDEVPVRGIPLILHYSIWYMLSLTR